MTPPGASPFVGRQPEIVLLRDALASASRGRGSVWLIQGEAGIGKSRLCEELARDAEADGVLTVWGRCWEAGGAPAFWPWLQALGQLFREHRDVEAAFKAHSAELSTVMPEIGEHFAEAGPPPSLEPEQARFRLLDAMTRTLARSAERAPVLVILEDLHAADPSSVGMFEFVSKLAQTMRLVVIGTLRDVDAMWSSIAPALPRMQRQAQVLSLPRLTRDDVQEFLSTLPGEPGSAALDAIYRVTEGHPLFVVETARLMAARGMTRGAVPVVPATVKMTLRERLSKLSEPTVALLRAASAFGRDVPRGPLAALLGTTPESLEGRLVEAAERSVLVDTGSGVLRFSHVLFQEVLREEVEPAERQRLHLAIARILEQSGDARPPWSVLAHHYLRAGAAGRALGIDAAVRAAAEASRRVAFEDAVDWHRLALDALEQESDVDPRERCRLLLGLGRARYAAGQIAAAEQTARLAGDVARAAKDASLFAEAALARAAAFSFGQVDPERVESLREALDGLPPGDSGLRAQVMARLAAALQPAAEPRGPIELAQRAVEMARRVDDPVALLATVRSAGSALADLAPPHERREINEEHIRLAEALQEPVEALRGYSRLVFDHVQVGNLTAARSTVLAAVRVAEYLGSAHYRWLPALQQAMMAAAVGDYASWERCLEEARQFAAQCSDPNAPQTLLIHEADVRALRGQAESALDLLTRYRPPSTAAFWPYFQASGVESLRISVGQGDSVPPDRFGEHVRFAVSIHDAALLREFAHVCVTYEDRANAQVLYDAFSVAPEEIIHGGFVEVAIKGPTGLPLGRLAVFLGHPEDAERHFSEALELARHAGATPFVEETERALAGLRARSAPPDRAAADVAADRARMPAGQPPVAGFALERDGELWRVRCGSAAFMVKDSRGMQMLERLVAEPGREFHASDLVSPGGDARDMGDAGEVLDPRARAEYERRVIDLRDELEEAESFGDPGREARAREELDFIASELGRAVGLGQRARRLGSSAERARVNAQRRLRDAIRRIAEHDPELGKHLDWAVKTGTFCSYSP